MGHARALINIQEEDIQLLIFDEILKNDYSVRKVEEMVRNYNEASTPKAKEKKLKPEKYPKEFQDLKDHLKKFFNTNVDFSMNDRGKGKIVIPFKSSKDLERILSILDNLESYRPS
jgi:ParB family chromosome partitioning protein